MLLFSYSQDNLIHILELSGGTLTEEKVIKVYDVVTALQFSPDGAFLASGGSNKNVALMDPHMDREYKVCTWTIYGITAYF